MPSKLILPILASLLLSACSLNPVSELTPTPTNTISPSLNQEATPFKEPENSTQAYTMEEVATHNSADSCWLVIEGKVYDVTSFVSNHPGGEAILEGCGQDATTLFNTRPMGSGTPHSDGARITLETYLIGTLE